LLYSRFFTKVLRDRGLVNVDEPFNRLLTQGMVQAETKKTKTGKYSNEYFSSKIQITAPISLLKNPKTGKYVEQADWFYSTPVKPIIIGDDDTEQLPSSGGIYYFDPDTGENLERVQDENGNLHLKNPKTGKYFDKPDTFECECTPVILNPIDGDDIEPIPSDGGMYYCYDLDGEPLQSFYEKMSKSKYNGVDPHKVLEKYGADTARMFILFKAPPEKDLEWDDADVKGQFSFLNRVWRLVTEYIEKQGQKSSKINPAKLQNLNSKVEKDLHRAVHQAIKEIAEDLDGDYQFNTAISELMKLNNALNSATCLQSPAYQEAIEALLILLAPFAPHISEELWHQLGHNDSVHEQTWLTFDPQALVVDEITLVIQIMGKTKGTIQVPSAATKEDLENYARNSEIFQKFLQGKEIKKVIVVPGKLVNFVAN
jgi:leucyl-tRNA synthetase